MTDESGSTTQAALSPWQQSAAQALGAGQAVAEPEAQALPGVQEPSEPSRADASRRDGRPSEDAVHGLPEAAASSAALKQEDGNAEQAACGVAGQAVQQAAPSQAQQQSRTGQSHEAAPAAGEAGRPGSAASGRHPSSGAFSAQLLQGATVASGLRHAPSEEGGNLSSHGSQKVLSFADSTLDRQVS